MGMGVAPDHRRAPLEDPHPVQRDGLACILPCWKPSAGLSSGMTTAPGRGMMAWRRTWMPYLAGPDTTQVRLCKYEQRRPQDHGDMAQSLVAPWLEGSIRE